MSYQSLDSDEFSIFSSGSCSPVVDVSARRDSSPQIINDSPLFQATMMPESVLKDDTSKVANAVNGNATNSPIWTLGDFVVTTTASSQPSLLPYESPTVTRRPLNMSWNSPGPNILQTSFSWSSSGTSSVPVTSSYGSLQNLSAEDVNFGGKSNILQQNDDEFSDAYDRVSFDGPQSQDSNLYGQVAFKENKKRYDLSPLPPMTQSKEVSLEGYQNINRQCYEAAISEHFGRKKHSKSGKYMSKVKNSLPNSMTSLLYGKQQRDSAAQSPRHRRHGHDFTESSRTITALVNETAFRDSNSTKTTFSTFTIPSIPSPLSPFCASIHSPVQADGRKSPKSPKGETDTKKYRYNQTALALQQSGLMKTTIKTAELLRKSRLLQQELLKLRKETSVFVHMVLNNPENKHLKDVYMPQQDDNSNSQ